MQAAHKAKCESLLDTLDSREVSGFFKGPPETGLPDERLKMIYRTEVPHPRDLLTIRKDLESNKYSSIMAFIEDVNLCFDNAKKFCKKRFKVVYEAAVSLQKLFHAETDKTMKELQSKVMIPPPSNTSHSNPPPEKKRKFSSMSSIAWTKGFETKCKQLIDSLPSWGYPATVSILFPPIDLSCFHDYLIRIEKPMAFSNVKENLRNNRYTHPDQVAADIRIIFSNFFTYNFSPESLKLRTEARYLLLRFEKEWMKLFPSSESTAQPFLKSFLLSMEEMFKIESSLPPFHVAIQNFIDPVNTYYPNREYPSGYLDVIQRPMHVGYIIRKVIQGANSKGAEQKKNKRDSQYYMSAQDVLSDMKLVLQNCLTFSADIALNTDARNILSAFEKSFTFDTSKSNEVIKSSTVTKPHQASLKPKKEDKHVDATLPSSMRNMSIQYLRDSFKRCLDLVKDHYMKPQVAGLNRVHKVSTAGPFLKAVDSLQFPDYYTIIKDPIDLTKIEKKLLNDKYFSGVPNGSSTSGSEFSSAIVGAIISFIKDFELLRNNAHQYNDGLQGIEVRIMADTLLHYFEALLRGELNEWLKGLEGYPKFMEGLINSDLKPFLDRSSTPEALDYIKANRITFSAKVLKSKSTSSQGEPALAAEPSGIVSDLAVPEIVQVVSKGSGKGAKGPRAKGKKEVVAEATLKSSVDSVFNGPPADEGEEAPFLYKDRDYSSWELACIDMLARLKKHEYVDPKRSGCIGNFFLPVVEIFPNIRDDYLNIIKQPMDLSTVENRLLTNGLLDAEDFIEKVLLVFQNAVTYNADHQDSEYAVKLTNKCRHLVGE